MTTITVKLVNLDNTHEERKIDADMIEEVGVIKRGERFYRYHGQDGTFSQKAIFTEVKMLALDAPPPVAEEPEIPITRSLLEAACKELREWKVDKGGDDQVVLNLEAALGKWAS